MKIKLNRITCCFALLLSTAVVAQYRFIENKGQWNQSVAFRTEIPGGVCYLEPGGLLFNLHDQATVNDIFAHHKGGKPSVKLPLMLQQHAYRLHFAESSGVVPRGEKVFNTRYSFFLGSDPEKWKGDLNAYERIVYAEIYPKISAVVYGKNNLKYDFIVAPGGNPEFISLRYEGVKPKLEKSGNISLSTACGPVVETKPFAYQLVDGKINQVECQYNLVDGKVKFQLGIYRSDLELVIDRKHIKPIEHPQPSREISIVTSKAQVRLKTVELLADVIQKQVPKKLLEKSLDFIVTHEPS